MNIVPSWRGCPGAELSPERVGLGVRSGCERVGEEKLRNGPSGWGFRPPHSVLNTQRTPENERTTK